MRMKRNFSPILIGVIIFLLGCFGANGNYGKAQAAGLFKSASVRIFHASPDAPPVDILIDDRVVLNNVAYKEASAFLMIRSGTKNIKVNAAGSTTTVINADVEFPRDSMTTIMAVDFLSQIKALVLPDTNSPPGVSNLKIRVVHGSPSAPAVDIYVSAPNEDLSTLNPTVTNLAFQEFTDFLEIPESTYQIRVTPTGTKTVVYDSGAVALNAGSILTAVAVNSTGGTSIIGLVALTNVPGNPSIDIPDKTAQLRVIHASPDAPDVDVLLDNEIVLSNIAFKQYNQDYLAVDSGARNIKVNAAGTNTTVIDATPMFLPGTDYTVMAVNFLADIEPLVLIDDNMPPGAGMAKVRVVHASPDAPNVDVLVDDSIVLTNVPFKGYSAFLEVEAGERNVKINATGTSATVIDVTTALEDGGVYLAIAVNELSSIEPLLVKTN